MLSPEQQAVELISRAKHILVITKEHASTDSVSSVVAISLWLQKLNKSFDAVIPEFEKKDFPSFLPQTTEWQPRVGAMRAFHIFVNVEKNPLSELMYDVRDEKLDVTLVPKQGEWTPQDLTFKTGEDRYDLVIALDAPDMNSLGVLAREHADFLYRTTILNIDHHATNEHWGQVELVDLNAASTTEILFHWFHGWNPNLLDSALATALLAGCIANTKSFRTQNITPKTLTAASTLVSLGGDREGIVHGLWRNRSIPTLKLWGCLLSRLNQDKDLGLVWATVTETDFLESGTTPSALEGVVDELLAYAPEARVIALFSEYAHTMLTHLFTAPPYSAAELARPFGGNGSHARAVFPILAPSLTEATAQTIERLKELIRIRK